MRRLNIVFGHVAGAQFLPLHRYLNESGLATSWLVCAEETRARHRDIPNLVAIETSSSHRSDSESWLWHKIKLANEWSRGIGHAIQRIATQSPVDIYIGHVVRGSPLLLFNNVDFPIVSYLEFPCFRVHGWDAGYPIPEDGRLADNNQEMLSLYSVMKSQSALVPSDYVRRSFPVELHSKIHVISDVGFRDTSSARRASPPAGAGPAGMKYIGFAAGDLSTAKGFELFVRIANRVAAVRSDVHFVVIGSPETPYGFERAFLHSRYGGENPPTFAEHVMREHAVDGSRFTFTGFLSPENFDATVQMIDLFLYPLQFGSWNWGLLELLAQGAVVIASNRCYLPEVIRDGVNGYLMDYQDLSAWVSLALSLLDDHAARMRVADAARTASEAYRVERVAPCYLEFFERVVSAYADGSRSCATSATTGEPAIASPAGRPA